MMISGYDAWKLETPPEYGWDEPEPPEDFEFFPPPDAEPMTDEDWALFAAQMDDEYETDLFQL